MKAAQFPAEDTSPAPAGPPRGNKGVEIGLTLKSVPSPSPKGGDAESAMNAGTYSPSAPVSARWRHAGIRTDMNAGRKTVNCFARCAVALIIASNRSPGKVVFPERWNVRTTARNTRYCWLARATSVPQASEIRGNPP